jgi:hypothetical protein
MPDDLKLVLDYTRRSAAVQAFILGFIGAEEEGNVHGQRDKQTCPTLPERTLDNFRRLIENLDHENGNRLADMIGCYQVQNSRLAGLVDDFNNPSRLGRTNLVPKDWTVSTLETTVELYLRANGVLRFARRQSDEIPPPDFGDQSFSQAFVALEIDRVLSSETQIRIARRSRDHAAAEERLSGA